jgi:hypothetical protein
MVEFIDKAETQNGTPINRVNLMALQGFIGTNIVFASDGSIVETNSKGESLTTRFDANGNIIEIFQGVKKITKTTTFNADGSITEVLS